jgi:hypothetical protein
MMNNDIQNILSGMLADWHLWSRHTADRGGFPGKAAGFGQCRSSSQYDWANGVEDEMVDRRIMQGFDASIQRIPNQPRPWFTALQFEARNLAVRHQVWASPRLPSNREEREVLILEARVRLLKELARDGVLC